MSIHGRLCQELDNFDGMLITKIPSMYSIKTVKFSFTVLVSAKARNCIAKITVCTFISCQSALDHW